MQKMKENYRKERAQHQEHPPFSLNQETPPKIDALGTLSVVGLQWATCQFWHFWSSNFACYNISIVYKFETLQCATILKHYKAKKCPIFERDNFVHTTL